MDLLIYIKSKKSVKTHNKKLHHPLGEFDG